MAGGMCRKLFLNLIVNEHTPGFKTLRRIDLTRQIKLFNDDAAPAPPPPADGSETEMDQQQLAQPPEQDLETPSTGFRRPASPSDPGTPTRATTGKCTASRSGTARWSARTSRGAHLPWTPRSAPSAPLTSARGGSIHIYTRRRPQAGARVPPQLFNRQNRGPWRPLREYEPSLFVMERFPEPTTRRSASGQFKVFLHDAISGYWTRRLLPPPPFAVLKARDGERSSGPVEITAYAMVGHHGRRSCIDSDRELGEEEDRSCICLSTAGGGTYCMDMDHHRTNMWSWTKAGEWTLPFHGKVEYVAELKLWFGFSSAASRQLAAADLSGIDGTDMEGSHSQLESPPQLVGGPWEQLIDAPKEWRECRDPQVVSLGSGRFCIARFFHGSSSPSSDDDGSGKTDEEDFAVLTGVEVVSCVDDDRHARGDDGDGNTVKLRMIRHKSRRLHGGGIIDTVF